MKKSRKRRKATKQIDSPMIGGVLIGDSQRPLNIKPIKPGQGMGIEFISHAKPWTVKQHGKKFVKGFVPK